MLDNSNKENYNYSNRNGNYMHIIEPRRASSLMEGKKKQCIPEFITGSKILRNNETYQNTNGISSSHQESHLYIPQRKHIILESYDGSNNSNLQNNGHNRSDIQRTSEKDFSSVLPHYDYCQSIMNQDRPSPSCDKNKYTYDRINGIGIQGQRESAQSSTILHNLSTHYQGNSLNDTMQPFSKRIPLGGQHQHRLHQNQDNKYLSTQDFVEKHENIISNNLNYIDHKTRLESSIVCFTSLDNPEDQRNQLANREETRGNRFQQNTEGQGIFELAEMIQESNSVLFEENQFFSHKEIFKAADFVVFRNADFNKFIRIQEDLERLVNEQQKRLNTFEEVTGKTDQKIRKETTEFTSEQFKKNISTRKFQLLRIPSTSSVHQSSMNQQLFTLEQLDTEERSPTTTTTAQSSQQQYHSLNTDSVPLQHTFGKYRLPSPSIQQKLSQQRLQHQQQFQQQTQQQNILNQPKNIHPCSLEKQNLNDQLQESQSKVTDEAEETKLPLSIQETRRHYPGQVPNPSEVTVHYFTDTAVTSRRNNNSSEQQLHYAYNSNPPANFQQLNRTIQLTQNPRIKNANISRDGHNKDNISQNSFNFSKPPLQPAKGSNFASGQRIFIEQQGINKNHPQSQNEVQIETNRQPKAITTIQSQTQFAQVNNNNKQIRYHSADGISRQQNTTNSGYDSVRDRNKTNIEDKGDNYASNSNNCMIF